MLVTNSFLCSRIKNLTAQIILACYGLRDAIESIDISFHTLIFVDHYKGLLSIINIYSIVKFSNVNVNFIHSHIAMRQA